MERIHTGKHLSVDGFDHGKAEMRSQKRSNRYKLGVVVIALSAALAGTPAGAAPPSDHALRASSFIGGTDVDIAQATAIDAAGNIYVAGYTASSNFPTTSGSFQPQLNGGPNYVPYDAFVTKVDPSGSRVIYSSYLGGRDIDMATDIDVDSEGNAYVTGVTYSSDFPTTASAMNNLTRSAENVFVTKVSADGSSLEYSALLGPGSATGIEVDDHGNAYVDGETSSSNYPTTPGTVQPNPSGNGDAFVSKLLPDGSNFVYSTFLGGSEGERPGNLGIDDTGAVVVAGITGSKDFPVSPNAFQPHPADNPTFVPDAFVTKLSPQGTAFVYSTYLGGSNAERNAATDVDADGNAFIAGSTDSVDFPTTAGAFQRDKKGPRQADDAFVVKFDPQGSLRYATYFGSKRLDDALGISLGPQGSVYIVGWTKSRNYPTTPGALKRRQGKNVDAFVTRISHNGSTLLYSTLYGGWSQYENGNDIDVAGGRIAFTGPTYGRELPLAGRPFQPDYAGSAESFVAAFSATAAVNSDVNPFGFDDPKIALGLGDTVQWHFTAKGDQSLEDRSGLDLFDSGTKGTEFHYAFTFFSAGRFVATYAPGARQQHIAVPMEATSEPDGIHLRWATEALPGYVFDVQVKTPQSERFTTLYEGTEAVESTYESSSGPGRYLFRARIRRGDNDRHSGWSPPVAVDVE